jgi:anti-sigma regulatory factor (Ser/Thr protein kinase)
MDPSSAWTSSFPGTVTGVIDALRWIEALATAQRFPEELSFDIQVCVEELFSNLVRHGGGLWSDDPTATGSSRTPIRMSIMVAVASDHVTVVLEDNGMPFDVAAAPPKQVDRPLEAARPGGLGIQLIKKLSSELVYDHVNGLNRSTLKFLWPQSQFSLL